MSRSRHSKHGGKGPGYEYWSPRPGPRSPGKDNKKITHSIERARSRKLINDIKTELKGEQV